MLNYYFESFIFMFSFCFPAGLFIFKRKFFIEKKLIMFITFIIAITGIIASFFVATTKDKGIYLTLINPFYAFSSYKILRLLFILFFKREPQNTAFNFKQGLFWDRVFNIIYISLITIFPLFLLSLISQQ